MKCSFILDVETAAARLFKTKAWSVNLKSVTIIIPAANTLPFCLPARDGQQNHARSIVMDRTVPLLRKQVLTEQMIEENSV